MGNMIFAGLVVETRPSRVEQVAGRLAEVPGVQIHGSNDFGLAISWSGETREDLDKVSETILTGDPDVIGIHPTYIGNGEEED